jgi:hypothetical protein
VALRTDDRGVSELIGFVFVFGFIIILLSIWQAQVVPSENAEIEYSHYLTVEDDMHELRSTHLDSAGSGETRSVDVKLGTTYPPRVLFVNGPPPRGQLQTKMKGNGTITADGFNTSNVCGVDSNLTTRSVVYSANYAHLSDTEAPAYKYENTVLYRQAPGGSTLYESDQTLIQGSTINLYPVTSNFSKEGVGTESVDFTSSEAGGKFVTGQINLSIPTNLTADQWAELLPAGKVTNTTQVNSNRVKIELVSRTWKVRCAVTGTDTEPSGSPPQDDFGGDSGGGGGVGGGSAEVYSEDDSSDTFTSENGRWVGITCTDQMILSDGEPASKPNGNNLQGDVIRLSGFLNDSTGESYTIDIKMARATDGSWNKKKVIIYDGNGNNVNAELEAAAAARIYEGGETDVLELSNYKDPDTGSGSFSDFVKRIRALEDDSPVDWQTSRMTGRVTVALECDPPPAPPTSGVSVNDGSTPSSGTSALKFDIQVASGTTKTITDVKITTPGNQNSNVQSANKLMRGAQREVNLDNTNLPPENQSGWLNTNVKLDGTKYTLDQNAVFSDGAVINVDMGDIDGGNVKWKYDIVDTQSKADVIVTFYFQDGTQFQVYLKVTNVNS